MIPVTMVQTTMGMTIILMQFSQISPMKPSWTIVFPPTSPARDPRTMAVKICVVREIFLPWMVISYAPFQIGLNKVILQFRIQLPDDGCCIQGVLAGDPFVEYKADGCIDDGADPKAFGFGPVTEFLGGDA